MKGKWEWDWNTNKRLKEWRRRYFKREKKKKSLYEKKKNITEKIGIKRNLQKNNEEEYLYNTNHHINKI